MRTPYMKLTVGDWFNRLPGVLSSVNLSWSKDYPWEIKYDEEGQDKDMLRLPHALDVSISFLPIHKFRPENSPTSPFINIDHWLTYGIADFTNTTVTSEDEEEDRTFKGEKVLKETPSKDKLKNTKLPADLNWTQELSNKGAVGYLKGLGDPNKLFK